MSDVESLVKLLNDAERGRFVTFLQSEIDLLAEKIDYPEAHRLRTDPVDDALERQHYRELRSTYQTLLRDIQTYQNGF